MKGVLAHACLLIDLLSMKLFVWLLGEDGELLDSHLYFFDKYSDLADYHGLRGRLDKAERLAAIAEMYFQAAPDDDDSPAAAMAMPVPRPWVRTNAVSTISARSGQRTGRSPRSIRGHLVPPTRPLEDRH